VKIIAYTALHYGSPYLGYAIRSILPFVNEYHVLYTPLGSHSHRTNVPVPAGETRDHLHAIASLVAGNKLRWHEGNWRHEGDQRDTIFELVPDADVVLVLDYDEIWLPTTVEAVLNYATELTPDSISRNLRLPMIHFWRSFHRAILHDPALPVRVIFPKVRQGENVLTPLLARGHIAHLGYAIPDELMTYKRLVHGHANEWRKDVDWYKERWSNADAVTDLHPVGSEYWNAEDVEPAKYLPEFMRVHPFYLRERIE
jgi:hypothetical protein